MKSLLGAVIGAAVIYALVAFVQWDLSAAMWSADARLFCAVFMAFAAAIGAGMGLEDA